jgi:hypothetical protein
MNNFQEKKDDFLIGIMESIGKNKEKSMTVTFKAGLIIRGSVIAKEHK